jgi:two-component system NtrC family sensor kinase
VTETKPKISRITESLAGKLFTIFTLLILSGSCLVWYISVETDKKDLMDNSVAFISSFSEMIDRSIRYDMLLNHREHIQRTLESISATKSVKRIILFNGKGTIHYSSERGLIGQRVNRTAPSCSGCHMDPSRPRETLIKGKKWTIYNEEEGHRVLSFLEPIYNERSCYTAQCHHHSQDQRVLGILMTDFSLYPFDRWIRGKIVNTSLFTLFFLVVSAVLFYLIFWKFIHKPIRILSEGMERVTAGDLSHIVPNPSNDELGRLALTFNNMTSELSSSRKKMETWTQTLQEEVEKQTVEIEEAHDRIVQAEKMAALGRLTADIAHEIRNPLSALGGFGRRLQKIAIGSKEKEYSGIIVEEVNRLEHILRDILTFSREAKLRFERIPVTHVARESITTFSELCAEHAIRVILEFATDLPILIDRVHVRQGVDNIVSNAIDAMPQGGTLTVSTRVEEINNLTYVAVHVADTGTGIPDDKLALVFEPFHTTKVIGHGTGLGLSITKKIIEEHGGFIRAKNNLEAGITFSLCFPYQSDDDLLAVPCWEFMKCERDMNNEVKCPAYPNFGRVCWVVAGTFCEGKVQGTFAQKYQNCRKCDFFKKRQCREI